ncbi:MAG: CHRD domain-containing protein [Chloroflexi bacterium]|nr:CHRD domain-containing protein [Chloroflexota bacterium]
MRKRMMLLVGVMAVMGVALLGGAALGGQPVSFQATLSGANEVPPVMTAGMGMATVSFDVPMGVATYRLEVRGVEGITQAHIHCAPSGANGPVAVFLAGGIAGPGVIVDGVWTKEGTFTAANLLATACGTIFEAFITSVAAGNTYVNVHTSARPAGEVRGQLVPGPQP